MKSRHQVLGDSRWWTTACVICSWYCVNCPQAQQLDIVMNWCLKWGMKIYAKKSLAFHVKNHQKPIQIKALYCCNQPLKNTERYKYLSTLFNKRLYEKPCVEALTGHSHKITWESSQPIQGGEKHGYKPVWIVVWMLCVVYLKLLISCMGIKWAKRTTGFVW